MSICYLQKIKKSKIKKSKIKTLYFFCQSSSVIFLSENYVCKVSELLKSLEPIFFLTDSMLYFLSRSVVEMRGLDEFFLDWYEKNLVEWDVVMYMYSEILLIRLSDKTIDDIGYQKVVLGSIDTFQFEQMAEGTKHLTDWLEEALELVIEVLEAKSKAGVLAFFRHWQFLYAAKQYIYNLIFRYLNTTRQNKKKIRRRENKKLIRLENQLQFSTRRIFMMKLVREKYPENIMNLQSHESGIENLSICVKYLTSLYDTQSLVLDKLKYKRYSAVHILSAIDFDYKSLDTGEVFDYRAYNIFKEYDEEMLRKEKLRKEKLRKKKI